MIEPLALGVMTHLPPDPAPLFERVQALGFSTLQLGYWEHPGISDAEMVRKVALARERTGVEITTIFCDFAGDSYGDVETVRRTVGLVPRESRARRIDKIREISAFASELGVERLAAHIGFVPENAAEPLYSEIVEVLQMLCDELAAKNQVFALETGQETAPTLHRLLEDVDRPNLKVNFDPANMILYGNDEPARALDELFPWIDGIHAKDGKWPTPEEREKGLIGQETPLGEGDVDFENWLRKLLDMGYKGPITIEREIEGEEQAHDLSRAKALIERVLASSA